MINNKDIRKTKKVYLEWIDSAAIRGWQYPDVYRGKAGAPAKICSIGYIVEEQPHFIIITTSISESGSAMDVLTIPKVAITKRRGVT